MREAYGWHILHLLDKRVGGVMPCNCWNSGEEMGDDEDVTGSEPVRDTVTATKQFLVAWKVHMKKGHTRSLLERSGVSGNDVSVALGRLKAWMLSGKPRNAFYPQGRRHLPSVRHPYEVDPSGLLDKAWHALILSDTAWYFEQTERLYGVVMHHTESV